MPPYYENVRSGVAEWILSLAKRNLDLAERQLYAEVRGQVQFHRAVPTGTVTAGDNGRIRKPETEKPAP